MYQSTRVCRFYCNVIEWLDSLGATADDGLTRYGIELPNIANTKPMSLWRTLSASTNTTIPVAHDEDSMYIAFPIQGVSYADIIGERGFIAYLGHNFRSIDFPNPSSFKIWSRCAASYVPTVLVDEAVTNNDGVVNWGGTQWVPIEYDGFSISLGDYSAVTGLTGGGPSSGALIYQTDAPAATPIQLNSIVLGSYYDLPISAQNITMTREIDGIKKVRTKGGNDLIDYKYTKSPNWRDIGAWELNPFNIGPEEWKLSRSGRRTWALSLSLEETDLFPMLSSFQPYESTSSSGDVWTDFVTSWHQGETLLDSNSFYSQVIHRTHNLAFIFQPNVDDKTNFAICKFVGPFKYKQTSPSRYQISLKIREVW